MEEAAEYLRHPGAWKQKNQTLPVSNWQCLSLHQLSDLKPEKTTFLDFVMMRFFQGELIKKQEKRRISNNSFCFYPTNSYWQEENKRVFFLLLSN